MREGAFKRRWSYYNIPIFFKNTQITSAGSNSIKSFIRVAFYLIIHDVMPVQSILTPEERRARRVERREKQRLQNIVRAAKMHEDRLAFEKERDSPKIITNPRS